MYCYMKTDKCDRSITALPLSHTARWTRGRMCGSHRRQPTTLRCSLAIHHLSNQHVYGRAVGFFFPTAGCMHAHCFFFVPYQALVLYWQTKLYTHHALCKLCTAMVVGVHLYQPTCSLWERLHTIMCTAYPTTMHLKAVCYQHTRIIEVHTTVAFVLLPTASQYIRRSII